MDLDAKDWAIGVVAAALVGLCITLLASFF